MASKLTLNRAKTDERGTVPDPTVPMVKVTGLVKHFRRSRGAEVRAVDDISIEVLPGRFTVLLGPSGCGKTTLLRCIAGLERPDSGKIEIRGRTVFDSSQALNLPPEKRGLNMIFQSYALWPHMTAAANVAYPLRCKKVPRAEIGGRVDKALSLVGIGDLGHQYPAQLSGGQQQRVALARAIVSNSELILFDEPLSNVDAKLREQLRLELMSMQQELGFAALYVTHDQTEAMELANDIAVLRNGIVEQHGSPHDIYISPRTRYVAGFIGTINEIDGEVREVGDAGQVVVETAVGSLRAGSIAEGVGVGDKVVVACRPERAVVSHEARAAENSWPATVKTSFFSGARTEHIVEFGDEKPFRVWHSDTPTLEAGTPVHVGAAAKDLRVIPRGDKA
jgi:iron(III) transport system ATP-binding protein